MPPAGGESFIENSARGYRSPHTFGCAADNDIGAPLPLEHPRRRAEDPRIRRRRVLDMASASVYFEPQEMG